MTFARFDGVMVVTMTGNPTESARSVGTARAPRWWPLALGWLLPVLTVSAMAGWALVREWREARSEAVNRARELVGDAAHRIASLVSPPTPVSVTPSIQANLGYGPDWFVVGPANELLDPTELPWPPEPSALPPFPVPQAAPAWDEARRASSENRWAAAIPAYQQVLAALPRNSESAAVSRYRALASFESACAKAQLPGPWEAEADLLSAMESPRLVPDWPLTEAGVPVAHLAMMRIVASAAGRAGALPQDWTQRPSFWADQLGSMPGSPFLHEAMLGLQPMLPELMGPGSMNPASEFMKPYLRRERVTRRHAEARRESPGVSPWPGLFWGPNGAWLAVESASVRQPAVTGRRFVVVERDALQEILETVVHDLDRRGDFILRFDVAGRSLQSSSRSTLVAGAEGRTPVAILAEAPALPGVSLGGRVVAWVADPAGYYAKERRRVAMFATLLGLAIGASLLAVLAIVRALRQQHQLNLRQSNFVASVSHELRAPLGSIRLLAESLERGVVTDEARRLEYFRLIGQETRRLGALVGNVLDFSRMNQGRRQYDFEPTDLTRLVHDTVRAFEPLSTDRGVNLEVVVPEDGADLEVVADGRALQQAVLNLLDNAGKHSRPGALVRVELSRHRNDGGSDEVRISVIDQGPGIPSEEHARIFEPFYRRGSEIRRETQGIGIGLSIVQHIVQAHRGRVLVDSAPGKGSTFTLVVPGPGPLGGGARS